MIKKFEDYIKEGLFLDKSGRLRRDSDEEIEFSHSPRSERLLMFIEDEYPNTDKESFKQMLIDKYDLEIVTKDIYTELALAVRDNIIPEKDLEDILTFIEEPSHVSENLATDVEVYSKDLEKEEIEKLDITEWEIKEILDIIQDPAEIEKIEEANVGFNLSSDMTPKNLKRGDTIYLNALLQPKNKSTAYAPNQQGVIKCRVIDLYYGLSRLKYL